MESSTSVALFSLLATTASAADCLGGKRHGKATKGFTDALSQVCGSSGQKLSTAHHHDGEGTSVVVGTHVCYILHDCRRGELGRYYA
jgi:hypothetical protein